MAAASNDCDSTNHPGRGKRGGNISPRQNQLGEGITNPAIWQEDPEQAKGIKAGYRAALAVFPGIFTQNTHGPRT